MKPHKLRRAGAHSSCMRARRGGEGAQRAGSITCELGPTAALRMSFGLDRAKESGPHGWPALPATLGRMTGSMVSELWDPCAQFSSRAARVHHIEQDGCHHPQLHGARPAGQANRTRRCGWAGGAWSRRVVNACRMLLRSGSVYHGLRTGSGTGSDRRVQQPRQCDASCRGFDPRRPVLPWSAWLSERGVHSRALQPTAHSVGDEFRTVVRSDKLRRSARSDKLCKHGNDACSSARPYARNASPGKTRRLPSAASCSKSLPPSRARAPRGGRSDSCRSGSRRSGSASPPCRACRSPGSRSASSSLRSSALSAVRFPNWPESGSAPWASACRPS